jgi:hypothetical protein
MPVRPGLGQAELDLLLQAGDADLEELIRRLNSRISSSRLRNCAGGGILRFIGRSRNGALGLFYRGRGGEHDSRMTMIFLC